MASFLAFLGAIPSIIALIQEFIVWIKKVSGNDPAGYVKKVTAAFQVVNAAKTDEERQNGAQAIADLISNLP